MQRENDYYFSKKYNSVNRFSSLHLQINLLFDLLKNNDDSILEIGVGNRVFSNFFQEKGLDVKTIDCNPGLKSDIVGDIRKYDFGCYKFDIVVAYEVLEHMDFNDALDVLKRLKVISSRYVVISVPYSLNFIELIFNVKIPDSIRKIITLPILRIPTIRKHKYSRERDHFWELGKRGTEYGYLKIS